jgi:hypothetical protein
VQVVEDVDGTRLVVLRRASDAWRVRDPATGDERDVDPAAVEAVEEASPLALVARRLDDDARRLVRAARDDRALGLLVYLDDAPRATRALLDETALCESELHGLLAEFRAGGLVAETRVDGRRGCELTAAGRAALDRLR